MDWADELAARVSGPQVVNDSKTPSGTVHVGSLRGPVILDVITRALRANGHRDDAALRRRRHGPDGRPGAPDARRDRTRDGPPAGARARSGGRLPRELRAPLRRRLHRRLRRPRDPSRPLLLDERDLPDRGDGSVHPPRARPRRAGARDLPPRRQRPASRHVAPGRRRLPELRQGRHDDRDRLGRREGLLRVPSRPRDLGARLRDIGLGQPVRWGREAALEPRVGRPVVAVRRDHRAGRQGPVDGRRLARPQRRDRPRGVRARAAAQRAVRVPQHRRQEDVDLQGRRRGGPHDRRGHPARAAALPVPAATPEPGDRVRSRRHRRDPAAVRRVRQVRRGDGRPRGQGRAAARLRGDVPLLAARSERRRRGRGGALPAGLLAPGAARPDPGRRRRRSASRRRRGVR